MDNEKMQNIINAFKERETINYIKNNYTNFTPEELTRIIVELCFAIQEICDKWDYDAIFSLLQLYLLDEEWI